MSKQRDPYLELCSSYILGQLKPRELRKFERHIERGCDECPKEIGLLRKTLDLLPLSLSSRMPSSDVKRHLMQAVAATRTQPAAPFSFTRRPWFGYAVTAGAFVLFLSIGLWMQINSLMKKIKEQEETITKQEIQLIELQGQMQAKEEILKVLQSPRINMVIMRGLKPSPSGYGKIIWDPVKKVAVFQVANLPTVPDDKDYQLWVIKNNKPISAGVFAVTTEKERESFFKVMNLAVRDRRDVDAFAVTLEPKGGVPQPSGQMYLIGSIQ